MLPTITGKAKINFAVLITLFFSFENPVAIIA